MSKKISEYITSDGMYTKPIDESSFTGIKSGEVYTLANDDTRIEPSPIPPDLTNDVNNLEASYKELENVCSNMLAEIAQLKTAHSNSVESIQDLISAIKIVNSNAQEKIREIDSKLADNISIVKSNQHTMQQRLRRALNDIDEQNRKLDNLKSKCSIVYFVLCIYAISIAGIIIYLMN